MLKAIELSKRATDLLSRIGLMNAPVDVETAAAKLGVQVHFQPLEDDFSGMLALKDGAAHIIVNSKHHPNRQRFTIAHELGHFEMHRPESDDRLFVDKKFTIYQRSGPASSEKYKSSESATTYVEEREANLFAEALLVPDALLKKSLDEKNIEVAMIDEFDVSLLASMFGVSEQMMAIKIEKLK